MSWYHSGIGFFINSTLTMASVYVAVWLVFFFSLTDSLKVPNKEEVDLEKTEAALTSTLATVQLFQLGLLSIIPFWGELCLETGFLEVCGLPSSTIVRYNSITWVRHMAVTAVVGCIHAQPRVLHVSCIVTGL